MVAEKLCKVTKMSPLFIAISLLDGLAIVMKTWGVLPLLKFSYDQLIFKISLIFGSKRGWNKTDFFLNQTQYFLYILLLMYYFLGLSFVLVLKILLTNQLHQLPFAILQSWFLLLLTKCLEKLTLTYQKFLDCPLKQIKVLSNYNQI